MFSFLDRVCDCGFFARRVRGGEVRGLFPRACLSCRGNVILGESVSEDVG